MKKMKSFIGVLAAAVIMLLLVASPVLAVSLGVSPVKVELEVPGNGTATADFKVHYFSGDVAVSLVDIPLKVEPETLHVEALNNPVDIELTIYGDESLGPQVYNGYIRFVGMSGGTVGVAVRVKAKITNVVEGQVPEEPTAEAPPAAAPPTARLPPAPPGPPPVAQTEGPSIILLAGIAAGAAVAITSIVMVLRRKRSA